MISDDGLYRLAIFLGSLAMLLIVLYHFLEVNAKEDGAGEKGVGEKGGKIAEKGARERSMEKGAGEKAGEKAAATAGAGRGR